MRKVDLILLAEVTVACIATERAYAGPFEDGIAAYRRKDFVKAAALLRPLAERGDALAQYYVGSLYEDGLGVKRDASEALQWYLKADAKGCFGAAGQIGYLYSNLSLNKIDIPRSTHEAKRWYLKSAQGGDPEGQYKIGDMYFFGESVAKDLAEARRWLLKSAAWEHPLAQERLGQIYDEGLGVEKDEEEAFKWYRAAAEQGFGLGAFKIGRFYFEGRVVPVDYGEAFFWLTIAAKGIILNEPKLLPFFRDKAGELLTPEQLAQTRERILKWKSVEGRFFREWVVAYKINPCRKPFSQP